MLELGDEEDLALTSSDLLARIQASETKKVGASSPDESVDVLQEKIESLEARIKETQANQIRLLEERMSDTDRKVSGTRNVRYLDTDDDDDDSVFEEERAFPDNTFSYLLLVRYPLCDRKKSENEDAGEGTSRQARQNSPDFLCLPFWLAAGILVVQITIYTLALNNAANFNYRDNIFNFPINVDPFTRAAEVCLSNGCGLCLTVHKTHLSLRDVSLHSFWQSSSLCTPKMTLSKASTSLCKVSSTLGRFLGSRFGSITQQRRPKRL
jgi:hypothetical protein